MLPPFDAAVQLSNVHETIISGVEAERAPPRPFDVEQFLNAQPRSERDLCGESKVNTPPFPLSRWMDTYALPWRVTEATEYDAVDRGKRGVEEEENEEKVEFRIERDARLALRERRDEESEIIFVLPMEVLLSMSVDSPSTWKRETDSPSKDALR